VSNDLNIFGDAIVKQLSGCRMGRRSPEINGEDGLRSY